MDSMVFGEFCENFTSELARAEESEGKDDTMSLRSLLKPKDDSPPPEDDDDFLKLNDGNYLSPKAQEAAEAAKPTAPSLGGNEKQD